MSQSADGEYELGQRNAWLFYLVVGGAGILLLPFTALQHERLWPELVAVLLLLAVGAVEVLLLRRPKPRSFIVRPGEFVAGPAYFQLATQAAGMPALVGVSIGIVADDDDWGVFTLMLFALTLVFAYAAVYALVMLIRGTGRLVLRPDGLTVVDSLATYDVPWEAIMAGPLPTVFGPGRLGLLWPELVRSKGLTRRRNLPKLPLQLHTSAVHREFLHDAVNHYLNHPEDRESIGTRDGLDRLLGALHA